MDGMASFILALAELGIAAMLPFLRLFHARAAAHMKGT
jgi:hypothetical protein